MTSATLLRPARPSGRAGRPFRWTGRLMLLPALLAVVVIAVYPLVYTVAAAFSDSSLGQPFEAWIGLDGFRSVLTNPEQWSTVVRSLFFAVPSAVLAVVLGTVVALSLDAAVRSGRVVRVVLLLPLMTPPVMAGVIWKLMLAPTGGLFNILLARAGITSEPVAFLGTSPWAMTSVVVVDLWQWTPLCTLLVYAALHTLPAEVYEAAALDGAGRLRTFVSVTLPLLLPSLVTVLLLKTVISFKVFDLVFVMTSGGPGLDTTVASYAVYRTALQSFDLGTAAVQTLVFVVLVLVVVTPLTALRHRLLRAVG